MEWMWMVVEEMKEHIVTGEQLTELQEAFQEDNAKRFHEILDEVRCNDFQNQREKVLDELERWCKPEDNELDRPATKKGDYVHASGRLLKKIKELRGEQ
jgi:hypothetical protein